MALSRTTAIASHLLVPDKNPFPRLDRMPRTSSKGGRRRTMKRRMAPRAGRVGPPVDVRSPKDIPRALDLLKKGPVTLVFIYADWCGHCKHFKPKYTNAVRTPTRNMQAIEINDAMVSEFNSALENEITGATPLTPEGYPEILLVNTKGKPMGNVPSSASENDLVLTLSNADKLTQASNSTDVTVTLNNISRNTMRGTNASNPIATRASLNNASRTGRSANSIALEPSYMPDDMTSAPAVVGNTAGSIMPVSPNATRIPNSLQTPPRPVAPSNAKGDVISEFQGTAETEVPRTVGGGLYSALASAAYNLAPTGILLAGLHAIRNRHKRNSSNKRKRSNKRTRRIRR